MTTSEIVGKILVHQIQGLMFHEQMAEYYRFLGLDAYAENHNWHYDEESESFKCFRDYYITHFNMLPMKMPVPTVNQIPDGWYRYKRDEVDGNTKSNAVKNGLTAWRKWEEDTKEMYQEMFSELMDQKEIALACEVKKMIIDVDRELCNVIEICMRHKSIEYDIARMM